MTILYESAALTITDTTKETDSPATKPPPNLPREIEIKELLWQLEKSRNWR